MVTDKLFLLSISEVNKYLPTKKNRKCKYKGWYRSWWLRSTGRIPYSAADVDNNGYLYCIGNDINDYSLAVRPALHLNLAHLQSLERTKKDYVKFADRKWIVLDKETGLLLAKKSVCLRCFDKMCINYEHSEIREYLNGELLNEMFNEEERKMIVDTTIDGDSCYPFRDVVARDVESDADIDDTLASQLYFDESEEELLRKYSSKKEEDIPTGGQTGDSLPGKSKRKKSTADIVLFDANKLVYFVNNNGIMEISQSEADGPVTVHRYHDFNDFSETNKDIIIPNGDMVMLINLYQYIKDKDIQNDFINPDGKNHE